MTNQLTEAQKGGGASENRSRTTPAFWSIVLWLSSIVIPGLSYLGANFSSGESGLTQFATFVILMAIIGGLCELLGLGIAIWAFKHHPELRKLAIVGIILNGLSLLIVILALTVGTG